MSLPALRAGFARRTLLLLLAATLPWIGGAFAAEPPATQQAAHDAGYRAYVIGDPTAARPGEVEPGLMLVGGGEWPYEAFRWMAARAGHGHIVILRASGDVEAQEEFYRDVGGIASARTFVFSDRKAASDPAVLAALDGADGIFIAGGDQSNYVRYWKGTPVAAALDRHVRAGKPLGGTSAGLAILGAWSYGAMDGGSLTTPEALRDPLGPGATLVGDFLHLPFLERVITDSHFAKRERLGRLVAFVARLRHEAVDGIVGLGIDESAALCIDGDGQGRLFVHSDAAPAYAWLVQPTQAASRIEAGRPLRIDGVRVTGVGVDSRIDLRRLAVDAPAFVRTVATRDGALVDVPVSPGPASAGR